MLGSVPCWTMLPPLEFTTLGVSCRQAEPSVAFDYTCTEGNVMDTVLRHPIALLLVLIIFVACNLLSRGRG
jgi:hypothetical protein